MTSTKNTIVCLVIIAVLLILSWPSFVAADHTSPTGDERCATNSSLPPLNSSNASSSENQTIENQTSFPPTNESSFANASNASFQNSTQQNSTGHENSSLLNSTLSNSTIPMNTSFCNLTFTITTDKEMYENKEPIRYQFHISPTIDDFDIEYWIEDLAGSIIRAKRSTTNTNQKSYTPTINVREKVLRIKALFFPFCSSENASAEKLVIVHNPDAPLEAEEEGGTDSRATKASAPSSLSTSSSSTSNEKKKASIGYDLLYVPSEAINDSNIMTTLQITNHHEAHDFEVWGYVYSGSVSISGHREQNKQSVHLAPWGSAIINLSNHVIAKPGEYKIKIKIRKDQQKTTTDLTKLITIFGPDWNSTGGNNHPTPTLNLSEAVSEQGLAVQPAIEAMLNVSLSENHQRAATNVLYESSTSKTKHIIVYSVIVVLAITTLVLIWKI